MASEQQVATRPPVLPNINTNRIWQASFAYLISGHMLELVYLCQRIQAFQLHVFLGQAIKSYRKFLSFWRKVCLCKSFDTVLFEMGNILFKLREYIVACRPWRLSILWKRYLCFWTVLFLYKLYPTGCVSISCEIVRRLGKTFLLSQAVLGLNLLAQQSVQLLCVIYLKGVSFALKKCMIYLESSWLSAKFNLSRS